MKEINLLPDKVAAKRIVRVYLGRLGRFFNRIYLVLILVVVAQVAIIISLSLIEKNIVSLGSVGDRSGVEVVDEIARINTLLAKFSEVDEESVDWSDRISEVLDGVPDGIKIVGLGGKADTDVFSIKGESSSRGDISVYREFLEKLTWVDRVEAPLENFTIDSKGGFSFDIFGKEKI